MYEIDAAIKEAQRALAEGKPEEAKRVLLPFVDQRHPEVLKALSVAQFRLGHLSGAIELMLDAMELNPTDPAIHYNMGVLLQAEGSIDDAIKCYRGVLEVVPGMPEAHGNLGTLLAQQGRHDEALVNYRKAAEKLGQTAMLLNNTGNSLKEQGRQAEAIEALDGALAAGWQAEFASNALLMRHYGDGMDAGRVFAMHQEVGQRMEEAAGPVVRHENDRGPERRIKVGYVSADFSHHPVGFFLAPVLEKHDRSRVEVYLYGSVARADAATARFAATATWRDIRNMSDDQAAAQVRQDGIDVLVDLGGHTAENRLGVFARRPAPVQVSWLGYPGTSGLSRMGWRITDAIADPAGEADAFHTERLLRVPGCFLAYRVPVEVAVGPSPAAKNGYVTFGSFNRFAKVTPRAIEIWARVLKAVPGSKLMIKSGALGEQSFVGRLRVAFGAHGIERRRLEFRGYAPTLEDHLRAYDGADVALDTFPYNGTTTTCEALAMGLPVVTLRGGTHAGRVSASLLTAAGCEAWVAGDEDAYVATAVRLAGDAAELGRIRAGLRERVAGSALGDVEGFARRLEEAYRVAWREWCGAGERA